MHTYCSGRVCERELAVTDKKTNTIHHMYAKMNGKSRLNPFSTIVLIGVTLVIVINVAGGEKEEDPGGGGGGGARILCPRQKGVEDTVSRVVLQYPRNL